MSSSTYDLFRLMVRTEKIISDTSEPRPPEIFPVTFALLHVCYLHEKDFPMIASPGS